MNVILSFLDNVLDTLKDNSYLLVVLGVCVLSLIILVTLLIVIKVKQNDVVTDETTLIRQTLKEQELSENEVCEEVKVEETKAEEVVEVETEIIEEVVEEEIKPEEPVEEDSVEVQEEATEEVKNEEVAEEAPVKKTRVVYGKYEIYCDGTSYYYVLKASNGEVLIKSETYGSKESIYAAIEAIKRNVEVGKISVRQDKHGLYQFVLTAKNHRTLVMSANYATEKRAQSASKSFQRFAANSPIVEIEETVVFDREEVIIENITSKKGGKLGVLSCESGYYYMLKASNGEVLVHSNFYKTEASALNAMNRFKASVFTGKFYVEKDKRNNYQFKLFSSNGRIVCVGHIYASKALAIASVNSVVSFVKLATEIEE